MSVNSVNSVEPKEANQRLRVTIVSSVLPRKCGIATFSSNFDHGISNILGRESVNAIAVNNNELYEYPTKVVFQIDQENLEDYWDAADAINESITDVVSLQHEFGLYGGDDGTYIVEFLSRLNKPVITTLHTVLEKPTPNQYKTLVEVAAFSKAIIVMNRLAIKILTDVYDIPSPKIHLIPHGVTDTFHIDPVFYKYMLDLSDRLVLLTFGLLSRNKGIETVLEALPPMVEDHPEILYIVLGITHPSVKKLDGEEYRESLEAIVEQYKLGNNVRFVDEFVDDETLDVYLGAADIVLCPYHSESQITSGVLSLALGKGKAIISTPYLHAKEALEDGKGRLVNFKDSAGMTEAILELIENPEERLSLAGQAFIAGQQMGWDTVSKQYVEVLKNVMATVAARRIKQGRIFTLPVINMNYLKELTDDVGIFQHTLYGIPDYGFDYSSDDAGRAIVAFAQYYNLFHDESALIMVDKYMSFLIHCKRDDGWFNNFMNFKKEFPPQSISQDTFGRCMWGLGEATSLVRNRAPGLLAKLILEEHLSMIDQLVFPRAQAYTACGLASFLTLHHDHNAAKDSLKHICDVLLDRYQALADGTWNWFEDFLSYDNARLSQALLLGYRHLGDPSYLEVGIASLDFLLNTQYNNGYFDMIGNEGWYHKGKEKALYSQQPVDAGAMTETCILAMELTGDQKYLEMAYAAFQWYLGRNLQGKSLFNPLIGSCSDGLDPEGPNENRGAESTISYVLAQCALYRWELIGSFNDPILSAPELYDGGAKIQLEKALESAHR